MYKMCQEKGKTTSTYKKPYKKTEKTNKWAPQRSLQRNTKSTWITYLWLQAVVLQHLVVPLSI